MKKLRISSVSGFLITSIFLFITLNYPTWDLFFHINAVIVIVGLVFIVVSLFRWTLPIDTLIYLLWLSFIAIVNFGSSSITSVHTQNIINYISLSVVLLQLLTTVIDWNNGRLRGKNNEN